MCARPRHALPYLQLRRLVSRRQGLVAKAVANLSYIAYNASRGEAIMPTIKSFDDGEFDSYLALPASGYGPGIVVLQEIFGINQFMRDTCDWYAAHGFVAI